MQDEKRAGRIISRMVEVLKKPLTVKTRIGWNKDNINVIWIWQRSQKIPVPVQLRYMEGQ